MTSLTKSQAGNQAKKAYIRGLTRYKEGNHSEAYQSFSEAINEGIEDFDILYYRGMCSIESGNFENAATDFEILVRNFPDNAEYLFRRGFIRYKTHDFSGAIIDFSKIPEDFPDFSIRWHYLSVLFFLSGNYKEALNAIERSLNAFPTMAKIWFNAGVIMNVADLSDRAELAFVTATRLDPRLTNKKREIIE
jgi:tetratricopeptide (TPR) repeat protein